MSKKKELTAAQWRQVEFLNRNKDYLQKFNAFVDYRKNPELYNIGKGEQGVLICQPYKSEICPNWRFKTPEIAEKSSQKIYQMFLDYLNRKDFVGADMARKYLQMGFTRARRYANHKTGRKYDEFGNIKPLEEDCMSSEKAISAEIFKKLWIEAKNNPIYLQLKQEFKDLKYRAAHT